MMDFDIQESQDIYERAAVEVIDQEDGSIGVVFRASQVLSCRRQLYYAGTGVPVSNEIPPDAIRRMEMGKALEPVILKSLEDDYDWKILDKGKDKKIQYVHVGRLGESLFIYVSGIPDAIGMEPGTVAFPIEIKTRNSHQWRRTRMEGAGIAHPGAVAQLAMYRKAYLEKRLIEPDVDCVLVSMNKDTSELHMEWFPPATLDAWTKSLGEYLEGVVESWEEGAPEPELSPDSWQCKSCEWKDYCGNVASEKDIIDISGDKISEEEALQALLDWENEKDKEVSVDKNIDKFSRSILTNFMLGQGIEKKSFTGDKGTWNVSLQQNDKVEVNEEMVRYYLTPEQWREVLTAKPGTPHVVIRKGRATKAK